MFVALRDIRVAKGRFALMSGVVALITLLVVLLSGLTAGLANQNISGIEKLPATYIVFGAPDGAPPKKSFSDSTVTADQVRTWRQRPGVTSAEPLGVTGTRATAGTVGTGVTVFGVAPDGALAPSDLDGHGAVLSRSAAEELDVAPGQRVTVGGRAMTVSALAADRWYGHTPVVWVPLSAWRQVDGGGDRGAATVIALSTAGGADIAAGDRAARTVTATTGDAATAIGSFSAENGSLTLMRGFLFAISALVIGAFFTVWTIQRQGDIAILRALGGSRAYLMRDALAQALVVLVVGAGLGGLAGAVGGAFARGAVPFVGGVTTLGAPVLIMIVLGMLGAALAVRRIASVDPLTALGGAR